MRRTGPAPGPARAVVAVVLSLGLALGLALAAGPRAAFAADDPAAAALAAISDLQVARVALDKAEDAHDRVAALTQTVQAYEAGLAALREGVRRAAIRERSIAAELAAEEERLGALLGVLLSVEAAPRPLLLGYPGGPEGAARAAMMLSDLAPTLRAEADGLRARLQELAALTEVQRSAENVLVEALQEAQAARVQLSRAISDRTELPRRFAADPAAMARMVASARTLDAFAASLPDLPPLDTEGDFAAARGRLPLPVAGRLLRRFGEPDAAGLARPGLLIAARPRSLVTAPWNATVRYAGPLRDYGNVMILEPAAGYLLVLAGLGEVYPVTGEIVTAGAPLGLMGGRDAGGSEFVIDAGAGNLQDRSETLYVELRQDQDPVDPAPWFGLDED